ncbi:MAG TPA: hypothetical protein VFM88_02640 [Vicinamibacteria bacterium]|nr:hypothetical protein [Vicinamibacteria bacterium]
MLVRLGACLLLLGWGAAAAQDAPDLAGVWKLNHELSDDVRARIEASAGSQYMSGGPNWAAETWIPWGTSFSEGQRVSVREFLIATVPAFEALEIEQSAKEVKTIHGESGVRIFNLTRASAGTSALGGETVTRQARWQGQQLVLDSKGKEGRLTEAVTLVPARNQLTYALRLEYKLLKSPLEVSLVYDRAQPDR